jgi:hypothetical protein
VAAFALFVAKFDVAVLAHLELSALHLSLDPSFSRRLLTCFSGAASEGLAGAVRQGE